MVFGRFRMFSDGFRMFSDGFRTFLDVFGRLLAIVDGFSLSWMAFRRPPIPVFLSFFFCPKGKEKCMIIEKVHLGVFLILLFQKPSQVPQPVC